MAWSWSHTAEAYDNAWQNIAELPKETLDVIYAEWKARTFDGEPDCEECERFNERRYDRALRHASALSAVVLAEVIWDNAEEQATCDNGGFNAWVCPYGCHTVSFDRK